MTSFKLTVRLGNEAMQSAGDIADVLRRAADSVESCADDIERGSSVSSNVRDANGNTVGGWSVGQEA